MAPRSWHEDSTCDRGRTLAQSGCLSVVQPGGMVPDPRAQTAARRLQAQGEEAEIEK